MVGLFDAYINTLIPIGTWTSNACDLGLFPIVSLPIPILPNVIEHCVTFFLNCITLFINPITFFINPITIF